jgi:hypothetical protein
MRELEALVVAARTGRVHRRGPLRPGSLSDPLDDSRRSEAKYPTSPPAVPPAGIGRVPDPLPANPTAALAVTGVRNQIAFDGPMD